MKWQPPETAPKDKTIIADVGLPCAVMAHWDEAENTWVYANLQCDLYHGQWNEYYFENEYGAVLKGWMPLPEVGR